MNAAPSTDLIVGVGSAHGDDQAGWRLVDTLIARNRTSAQLRKVSSPHELIDWLEGCECLHVVDACDRRTDLLRLDISSGCIPVAIETRSSSSHQVGVGTVVELAKSLGLLPQRALLWAIPGESFAPHGDIGDGCQKEVENCAGLIEKELGHA